MYSVLINNNIYIYVYIYAIRLRFLFHLNNKSAEHSAFSLFLNVDLNGFNVRNYCNSVAHPGRWSSPGTGPERGT